MTTMNAMNYCCCCNNLSVLFLQRTVRLKLGLNEYRGFTRPYNVPPLGVPYLFFGFIPVSKANGIMGLKVCLI